METIMLKSKCQSGLIVVCLCLTVGLVGCAGRRPAEISYPSNAQTSDTAAKRFQEPDTGSSTLIESAVELSDKYAKLTTKTAELQQLNQGLQQENGQQKLTIESLKTQIKQLEAQLDESNRLVMDLNGEMQMWKKDILGFRSEMRAAATAQINALMKIMTAIGVENGADDLAPEENAADRPIPTN
jgi:TolA-binding protein